MILGVDHVAVAGTAIEENCAALERRGLKRRFVAKDVPNAGEKRALLYEWRPSHDLAVLDGASGIPVEITAHGSVLAGAHLGFIPVIGSQHGEISESESDIACVLCDALGTRVGWTSWPEFHSGCWQMAADAIGIRAVVCLVRDYEASRSAFRTCLRFEEITQGRTAGRRWCALRIAAPVARWSTTAVLVEAASGAEAEPLMLDSIGFPCLALLSTDVAGDLLRYGGGQESSATFHITVGGKPLAVGMARGPSGEILEFIEIKRN